MSDPAGLFSVWNFIEGIAALAVITALVVTGVALVALAVGAIATYGLTITALGAFAVDATAVLSPLTGVMGVGGAAWFIADEESGAAAASLQSDLTIAAAHLEAIDSMVPENEMMLNRIADALQEGRPLTEGEQNFLTHETTEARLMAGGMGQPEAHAQALMSHPAFANYDPEVIKALPDRFNPNWLDYWNNR